MEDLTFQENGHMEFVPSSETYEWLDMWLKREASPEDVLAWSWLYGEAHEGSGWTREEELSKWIAESQVDRSAWRGVQRLLERLRRDRQPIPLALLVWALEVADGTRKPPPRKKGRDGTQNFFRNFHIVTAVMVMKTCGFPATSNTGQSACHVVARYVNLSYEAVRTIWLKHKNTAIADSLNLDWLTWRGRNRPTEQILD